MLGRLWFRLLLGMSLALAVAVGTVALLMKGATQETFTDYVEEVSAARAARVENVLARHYQRYRSWEAVEPIALLMADLAGQRVVVTDSTGRIVADSLNRMVGEQVQPGWAREPIIITHQETPVGSVYLDPLRPNEQVDIRGQTFLALINKYLLWAAAAGLLSALILSLLLSRWLAAPLEAVTRAARRMARGDLSQKIQVRIGGEVGALAQAFNSTAASLARIEQLRAQMVTDIAHELRTPLTNIRGYLEAIEDGVVQPDRATIGILSYELNQLTRLVDDLQELALVEAGQLTLSFEDVDVRELVARELRALRPQAEAHGVELTADLASKLPVVSVDPGRLGQAMRNVLRNALNHTQAGGQIIVVVTQLADSLVVRIRDSGAGIDPNDLPHIFERFYRVDKSRARQGQGGCGLGLTICRELVQAHGGQVTVQSKLGEGTEFTIRLPLVRPVPIQEPEQQVEAPVPSGPPLRRRLELLRTGVAVAALFGALAGVIEALMPAVQARRAESFAELFGYAVVLDAAAFGLLGALATVLLAAGAKLMHRRLIVVQWVSVLAPAGCLLIGAVAYIRWKQLYGPEETLVSPQTVFAQIAIFGLAAGAAVLAGALLAPGHGSAPRALVFGRKLAPASLAVLIALASVSIARDLGSRGLSFGGPAAPAEALGQAVASAAPAPLSKPNVLLVTISSLRADRLGSAGYSRARTPVLDGLASEGVRFARAISNQPSGSPAHASILTGTYPATHGVRNETVDLLPHELPTLAETFTAQGYVTAGLFSSLSLEGPFSGLDRGFQTYTGLTVNRPDYLADNRTSALAATYKRLKSMLALPSLVDRQTDQVEPVEEQLDGRADVTTDAAIGWLEQYQTSSRVEGQPFFLWVQYLDPQYPYTPPASFAQIEPDECQDCLDGGMSTIRKIKLEGNPEFGPAQVKRLLQYYDGEIAFTDRELGRLLRGLTALGLDQDALIVVASDHGESFGEGGHWLHGTNLQSPEIHIPLIMRFPGRLPRARTVDTLAQQIDIAPTILDLLQLPAPARMEGQSLMPQVHDVDQGEARHAVAELPDRSMASIITRDWRLVKNNRDGAIQLFGMAEETDDLRDLADTEPEVAAELEAMLEQWKQAHP